MGLGAQRHDGGSKERMSFDVMMRKKPAVWCAAIQSLPVSSIRCTFSLGGSLPAFRRRSSCSSSRRLAPLESWWRGRSLTGL